MKALNPTCLECCFCGKKFQGSDIVAVVSTHAGVPAATHLNHVGVREHLISHPSQVTTVALLFKTAESFNAGMTSDQAFSAMAYSHSALSEAQRARLQAMCEEAYTQPNLEDSEE